MFHDGQQTDIAAICGAVAWHCWPAESRLFPCSSANILFEHVCCCCFGMIWPILVIISKSSQTSAVKSADFKSILESFGGNKMCMVYCNIITHKQSIQMILCRASQTHPQADKQSHGMIIDWQLSKIYCMLGKHDQLVGFQLLTIIGVWATSTALPWRRIWRSNCMACATRASPRLCSGFWCQHAILALGMSPQVLHDESMSDRHNVILSSAKIGDLLAVK